MQSAIGYPSRPISNQFNKYNSAAIRTSPPISKESSGKYARERDSYQQQLLEKEIYKIAEGKEKERKKKKNSQWTLENIIGKRRKSISPAKKGRRHFLLPPRQKVPFLCAHKKEEVKTKKLPRVGKRQKRYKYKNSWPSFFFDFFDFYERDILDGK